MKRNPLTSIVMGLNLNGMEWNEMTVVALARDYVEVDDDVVDAMRDYINNSEKILSN